MKKMFLHGFLIKQYNPTGFMILWKPVKGCLHTWYAGYRELKTQDCLEWTEMIYHCNGNCMINSHFKLLENHYRNY